MAIRFEDAGRPGRTLGFGMRKLVVGILSDGNFWVEVTTVGALLPVGFRALVVLGLTVRSVDDRCALAVLACGAGERSPSGAGGALMSWPSAVNSPERFTGFFNTIGLRSSRGIDPDLWSMALSASLQAAIRASKVV